MWLGRWEDAGENFVVVIWDKDLQLKRQKIQTQKMAMPPATSVLRLCCKAQLVPWAEVHQFGCDIAAGFPSRPHHGNFSEGDVLKSVCL